MHGIPIAYKPFVHRISYTVNDRQDRRTMNSRYFFLIVFSSLWGLGLLGACTEPDPDTDPPLFFVADADEVLAISFGSTETTDAEWTLGKHPELVVVTFDKRDYPDADYIIFKGEVFSTTRSTLCYARLYNLTDNEPIRDSEVFGYFQLKSSVNIISSLPDKEIQLGLQIRSENPGVSVGVWNHSHIVAGK